MSGSGVYSVTYEYCQYNALALVICKYQGYKHFADDASIYELPISHYLEQMVDFLESSFVDSRNEIESEEDVNDGGLHKLVAKSIASSRIELINKIKSNKESKVIEWVATTKLDQERVEQNKNEIFGSFNSEFNYPLDKNIKIKNNEAKEILWEFNLFENKEMFQQFPIIKRRWMYKFIYIASKKTDKHILALKVHH